MFPLHVQAADPIGAWNSTSQLPAGIASHTSFALNHKIFIFGGANNDDTDEIDASIQDGSGSISSWILENKLPQTLYWSSMAYKGERIYLIGGASFNGVTNFASTVFTASVQNSGVISNWNALDALPIPLAQGSVAIVGNWIFVIGGRNDFGGQSAIYYALINSDGTIGTWDVSSTILPEDLYASGTVVSGNHIILIGGVVNGVVTNKVIETTVDISTGSLSPFQEMESLPHEFNGSNHAIIVGSKIITVGGGDNNGPLNNVYYTDVDANGVLSAWQESSNSLPISVGGGSVAYLNGYLYIMGGYNGAYLNDVYFSKLNLDVSLNVPLVKQTDPSWANELYDSANYWAPSGQRGINNWGCALTSAVMVFQYNKINKLPDNSSLTPDSLNSWLINQPDGYISNGLVNWLALSRLSKIAKSKNPNLAFDALEYSRYGLDKQQLKTDLENNVPGILEEPGHYIVAKGTSGSTFQINDPFYSRTLLSDYSETFLSLGRFVPSNTDLSYLMMVLNKELNLPIKTSSGSAIGDEFIQKPLVGDLGSTSSGEDLKIIYVPKPNDDMYLATLSSSLKKEYNLDIYFYDEDGNVKIDNFKGVIEPGSDRIIKISFKKNSGNNNSSDELITFEKLKKDLKLVNSLKHIKRDEVYDNLKKKIDAAKKADPKNKKTAKKEITDFIGLLVKHRGKLVDEFAYQMLSREASSLIEIL